jgi:hypothetical protein
MTLTQEQAAEVEEVYQQCTVNTEGIATPRTNGATR